MTKDEAIRMAREALEEISTLYMSLPKKGCMALAAIEEVLAQPEQEPVAWATQMGEYAHIKWGAKRPEYPMVYEFPLYTSPPASKPWVGLTDEEMHDCWDSPLTPLGMKHVRMIEAKLREKNA